LSARDSLTASSCVAQNSWIELDGIEVPMGILDWLFGGGDDAAGPTIDPAVIDQRIEQVVQIVNPRLKLVPGYHRKLAPAVAQAVLYCRELEAQIPSGLDMSAAAWSDNPVLRAVFATAQDVPALFSRCPEVQDFFEASPGADGVWVSLRFRRKEEKCFGMAAQGEVVQHDVAQTSVSFVEKKILQPCLREHDARIEIRRRAFKFLVTQALEQIASVNTRRKDLIEQRTMLQTRLAILKGQHAGLESMLGNDSGAVEKIENVERKLAENEMSLRECPSAGESIDYIMKRVRSVLTHGSDYLEVRPVRIRLDQMNIMVPEGSPATATEILLPEVLVKHVPQIELLVGRFPRSELIPRGSLLDQAQRLLG
jgi:hypothetical protein